MESNARTGATLSRMSAAARDQGANVARRSREMIEHHPAQSSFALFALGFGVGLAIVACLPRRQQHHSWYEDYQPGRLYRSYIRPHLPDAVASRLPA